MTTDNHTGDERPAKLACLTYKSYKDWLSEEYLKLFEEELKELVDQKVGLPKGPNEDTRKKIEDRIKERQAAGHASHAQTPAQITSSVSAARDGPLGLDYSVKDPRRIITPPTDFDTNIIKVSNIPSRGIVTLPALKEIFESEGGKVLDIQWTNERVKNCALAQFETRVEARVMYEKLHGVEFPKFDPSIHTYHSYLTVSFAPEGAMSRGAKQNDAPPPPFAEEKKERLENFELTTATPPLYYRYADIAQAEKLKASAKEKIVSLQKATRLRYIEDLKKQRREQQAKVEQDKAAAAGPEAGQAPEAPAAASPEPEKASATVEETPKAD